MLRQNRLSAAAGALLAGLLPSLATADPVDKEKGMICSAAEAYECSEGASCDRVRPDEIGAPRFFRVDLAKRVAQGAGAGAQARQSPIQSLSELEGLLVMQGVDQGREGQRGATGWSASISPDDGGFVLVAAGDGSAFLIFGACLNGE